MMARCDMPRHSEAGYIDARPLNPDRRYPLATHGRTIVGHKHHLGLASDGSLEIVVRQLIAAEHGMRRLLRHGAACVTRQLSRPQIHSPLSWPGSNERRERRCQRAKAVPLGLLNLGQGEGPWRRLVPKASDWQPLRPTLSICCTNGALYRRVEKSKLRLFL